MPLLSGVVPEDDGSKILGGRGSAKHEDLIGQAMSSDARGGFDRRPPHRVQLHFRAIQSTVGLGRGRGFRRLRFRRSRVQGVSLIAPGVAASISPPANRPRDGPRARPPSVRDVRRRWLPGSLDDHILGGLFEHAVARCWNEEVSRGWIR